MNFRTALFGGLIAICTTIPIEAKSQAMKDDLKEAVYVLASQIKENHCTKNTDEKGRIVYGMLMAGTLDTKIREDTGVNMVVPKDALPLSYVDDNGSGAIDIGDYVITPTISLIRGTQKKKINRLYINDANPKNRAIATLLVNEYLTTGIPELSRAGCDFFKANGNSLERRNQDEITKESSI